MTFAGWVAIPRSILNNTHTGKLSNNEQLVLLTLILLADAKTGSGYINAAAIRTYLPELKYETAKRVLKSLEDKRMIYRAIKHASTGLYPYWLHGYQLTDGPHKMLWTNLSQTFVTRDLSAIGYDDVVPADTPAVYPEDTPAVYPEDAPNNNKDKDNHTDKDLPLGSMRGERNGELNGERDGDSRGECNGEREVSARCADGERNGEDMGALPLGIIFRDGNYFTESGTPVHLNALAVLLPGKETA